MPFKNPKDPINIEKARKSRRNHYYSNREIYKKRAINRRKEIQKYLLSYLQNHPCVDCGENDPVVLEFDHIKGTKLFVVGSSPSRGVSTKTLEEEISKCQIRCANCHKRKTAKESNSYKIRV